MSSRSAVIWVGVFLVLAFAGGGGFDLFTTDDDNSPVQGASLTGRVERIVDGDTVKVRVPQPQPRGDRALHRRRHAGVGEARRAGAVLRLAREQVQRPPGDRQASAPARRARAH